jgi:hypothetical protein
MKLNITSMQHHRNGISGASFHAVTFRDREHGPMFAVVFEQPYHVAVFQLDKLAKGDIEFGSNSWRGDEFEPGLRRAIHEASDEQTSTCSPQKLIRMLMDEIESFDEPEFSTEQADFLERRLAEIQFALESEGQP